MSIPNEQNAIRQVYKENKIKFYTYQKIMTEEIEFDETLLNFTIIELNIYIKQFNLSDIDIQKLKAARRRHKNRIYSRRARSKKKYILIENLPNLIHMSLVSYKY
jgi:hypothetical protein